MSRYLLELSIPDRVTTKQVIEVLSPLGVLVRSMEKGTIQSVVDEVHALRDQIEGRVA